MLLIRPAKYLTGWSVIREDLVSAESQIASALADFKGLIRLWSSLAPGRSGLPSIGATFSQNLKPQISSPMTRSSIQQHPETPASRGEWQDQCFVTTTTCLRSLSANKSLNTNAE